MLTGEQLGGSPEGDSAGKAFPDGNHIALSHWSAGGSGETDPSKQVGAWQYCSDPSGEALEDFMLTIPAKDIDARVKRLVFATTFGSGPGFNPRAGRGHIRNSARLTEATACIGGSPFAWVTSD